MLTVFSRALENSIKISVLASLHTNMHTHLILSKLPAKPASFMLHLVPSRSWVTHSPSASNILICAIHHTTWKQGDACFAHTIFARHYSQHTVNIKYYLCTRWTNVLLIDFVPESAHPHSCGRHRSDPSITFHQEHTVHLQGDYCPEASLLYSLSQTSWQSRPPLGETHSQGLSDAGTSDSAFLPQPCL